MFDVFGNIKSLLKVQTVCIDNNIFRMHYQFTLIVLFLFSIIVNSRQYFGDPIDCTASDASVTRVIDNYCWIHIFRAAGPFEETNVHGVSVSKQTGKRYLVYYQWVGFVLFFQAILFFIPRYLWRYCWEEGKVKGLASGMKGPSTNLESETARKKLILNYLHRNIGNHNMYFLRYVICEILNLINIIVQIFAIDAFLGYEFSTYGTKVLRFINEIAEERTDPMNVVFPKVAECEFQKHGHNGGVESTQSLCVLPVNIFNEKIYVFLWFWFITLTVFTCLGLAYRILSFIPEARAYILHRKTRAVHIGVTKHITRHIAVGDWFLLYQIGKNVDPLFFGELLVDFGDRVGDNRYHELHEIKSDSRTSTISTKINI